MSNKVVAMILAGGKGTRLESLTKKTAKPAVSFAAKYRIIDFPLSNCANSNIDTVGVLTQYESAELDSYVGNGEKWGLNGVHASVTCLAPRQTEEGASWYKGTADAITQNIDFLDNADPDYVIILSGDHIYKTRFNDMIELHASTGADATISVIEVDPKEASRFGIMVTNEKDEIVMFQEKPKKPMSNLASMGIYCFTWKTLRKYLKDDAKNPDSEHDFGNNIIPQMLGDKRKMMAYRFNGYWRDVGTLASLHSANMDIIDGNSDIDLYNDDATNRIFTEDFYTLPQYIGARGEVKRSLINQGAFIEGSVNHCVISNGVMVEKGAVCTNAVIMSGAIIGKNAKINNCIIGPDTIIEDKEEINVGSDDIVLISRSRR